MDVWNQAHVRPDAKWDPEAWAAVWQDFSKVQLGATLTKPLDFPVNIVLGEFDPIVTPQKSGLPLKNFNHLDSEMFSDCSNFAHLERPERFMRLIQKLSRSREKVA